MRAYLIPQKWIVRNVETFYNGNEITQDKVANYELPMFQNRPFGKKLARTSPKFDYNPG